MTVFSSLSGLLALPASKFFYYFFFFLIFLFPFLTFVTVKNVLDIAVFINRKVISIYILLHKTKIKFKNVKKTSKINTLILTTLDYNILLLFFVFMRFNTSITRHFNKLTFSRLKNPTVLLVKTIPASFIYFEILMRQILMV